MMTQNYVNDDSLSLWIKRYNAIRKSLSHYLFALIVLGLFFMALSSGEGLGENIRLKIPILEIELQKSLVDAFGPIVIMVLVLGVLGSLRAEERALFQINQHRDCKDAEEMYDETPNLIDLAMDWSMPSTIVPSWLRSIKWVTVLRFFTVIFLPFWLTLFFIESCYLMYMTYENRSDVILFYFFAFVWFVLFLPTGYRMIEFLGLRITKGLRLARDYYKKKTT